jgi:hypothetical protein
MVPLDQCSSHILAPLCEVDGEVLDEEEVVSDSCHAAGKALILQPYAGV